MAPLHPKTKLRLVIVVATNPPNPPKLTEYPGKTRPPKTQVRDPPVPGMPDGLAIGVTTVDPASLKWIPEILDGLGKAKGWATVKRVARGVQGLVVVNGWFRLVTSWWLIPFTSIGE